jgi:hypothetical protein
LCKASLQHASPQYKQSYGNKIITNFTQMGDRDFTFLEMKNKGSSFEGTNTLILLLMFLSKMQYNYIKYTPYWTVG